MSPTAIPAERAALVKSIHDLADWVEANPDVPLDAVSAVVSSDYSDRVAQVVGLASRGFALEGSFQRMPVGPRVSVDHYVDKKFLTPRIVGDTVVYEIPEAVAA